MFSERIQSIENTISVHQSRLNNESLWVFLAAVSTWSIPVFEMQVFAYFVISMFFFYSVYGGNSDWRSFARMYTDLETQIEAEAPDEDIRDANLHRLNQSRTDKLNNRKIIYRTFRFNAAFLFFIATMTYAIWPNLPI